MNYYEENLELFRNEIPMLYETIVNEKAILDIGLEKIDDTLNYTIVKDEKRCFIHSIFDIDEEMNQMLRNVDENVKTIIIFGIGCGYALNYIKNHYNNIKNILIIEPSLDIFKKLMESVKINDEIKHYENVTFVVNKNVNYVSGIVFEYIKDKIAQNVSLIYNISYRTIFNEYYEEVDKKLANSISKTKINLGTNRYFIKQWTYNPIKNLKQNDQLVDNLFNKFEGKSAIIVSAGPSLNKNIHLLKCVKNKALIASVGTASKILESNNIKPHLRFAMDSLENEKVIFEGLKEDDSILVYSDRVHDGVAPIFKRRLRMILDSDYVTRYIYNNARIEFKTIQSGFSIANTALDALIKLGFKNIIFLGQDMCYTQDKLYADGSWLKKDKIDFTNGEIKYKKMRDINENDVYTNDGFLGIKTIFETIILNNPNVNYINATEGGLGIEGTKIKTFKQVLNEDILEEYDYDSFFKDLFNGYNDNKDCSPIHNIMINLEDSIDKMLKINELRIKGLKKIDRYLNKGLGIGKIERETAYLNKYEEELRKMEAYNNFIKLAMNNIYLVVLNKLKYEGDDAKEAILNSKKVLEIISDELQEYLLYVKACIRENFEQHE